MSPSPTITKVLFMLSRYLLAGIATFLVTHEIIDKDLADQFLNETAQFVLGILISEGLVVFAWLKTTATDYWMRNMAIAGSKPENSTPEKVVAAAALLKEEGSKPTEPIVSSPGIGPKAIVGILLAVGLAGQIGCASNPRVATTPQVVVAQYASDILRVVAEVQTQVTTYALNQGGRSAQTDKVMNFIRDEIRPVAGQLSTTLKQYDAVASVDLRNAKYAEVLKLLTTLEGAVESGLKKNLPEGIPQAVATSASEINKLIATVRLELSKLQSR